MLGTDSDHAEKHGRGRPEIPGSRETVRERGSPRPSKQVEARTVAGAATRRARIAQERARPQAGGVVMDAVGWVGIDVSKRWLDVALCADGEVLRVPNDEQGMALLTERFRGLALARNSA